MRLRSGLILGAVALLMANLGYAAIKTYQVSCPGAPDPATAQQVDITYLSQAPYNGGTGLQMIAFSPKISGWKFSIDLPDKMPNTAVIYAEIRYTDNDPNRTDICIANYLPASSEVLDMTYSSSCSNGSDASGKCLPPLSNPGQWG